MIRGLAKTATACALNWSGMDRLAGAWLGSRTPLVLGYHRVVEKFPAGGFAPIPAMMISTAMLERQLDWVGRHYRFVSLDELGAGLEAGDDLSRAAAVTFDDGYSDGYFNAFPLLRRKGIPAAMFVVTDLLDTARVHTHDVLFAMLQRAYSRWTGAPARIERLLGKLSVWPGGLAQGRFPQTAVSAVECLFHGLPQKETDCLILALESELGPGGVSEPADPGRTAAPLTWEMVREMHRAGMTIGSHTKTHPVLIHETRQMICQEAAGSRESLARGLAAAGNAEIRHFAYPCGQFNSDVVDAVAASGYRYAYTTCQHRDPRHPLLTIPRRVVWEKTCVDALGRFSPAILSCQVNGVFDILGRCTHQFPVARPARTRAAA